MSWSFYGQGTSKAIGQEFRRIKETFRGQSGHEEMEKAEPHILGLLALNFAEEQKIMRLEASGHSYGNNSSVVINLSNLGQILEWRDE
jgi:hypothetical protein